VEQKDQEILQTILKKRAGCIPLSVEEQKWADETVNKLLDSKRTLAKKDWFVVTGDQFRELKKVAFAGTAPKQQGFEGGYNKPKEKLPEADAGATLDKAKSTPKAEEPFRPYEESKGKPVTDRVASIEDDDTSGTIKADARSKEYGDTDEKEHEKVYEEDRIAEMTQGKHQVADDVSTKTSFYRGDIVVRETRIGKEVGQVLNVSSKGGLTVLWKSSMTQTFENPANVRKVYKGKLVTKNGQPVDVEEKEHSSPPVTGELSETKKDMTGAYESNDADGVEEETKKFESDVMHLADQVIDLGNRVNKIKEPPKKE